MVAEFFETIIIDGASAMTDAGELGKALKLCVGAPCDCGADEVKGFEAFQARELFHPNICQLAVIGESQCFEACQFCDVGHPRVVELGGDDVERFEGGDVAEVLEKCGVVGILFAMIVGSCTGHREIDQFEAFPVLGFLNLSFGTFHGAKNRFDVGVRVQRVC